MHALRLRRALAGLVLCCSFMPVGHAAIFEDGEARRAILEMRQRVDAMQQNSQRSAEDARRASEDSSQLRRSLLDLQTQIETLRVEMASCAGKTSNSYATWLSCSGTRRKSPRAWTSVYASSSRQVSLDGLEFQAEPAEKKDFETALAKFREGRFADAEAAYTAFLRQYPRSGYGPSVRFWLGNAQYANRNYKEAIGNFKICWQTRPATPVPPEAALAIANCQIELKETRGAQDAGRSAACLSAIRGSSRCQGAARISVVVHSQFVSPGLPMARPCLRCSSAGLRA